MTKQRGKKIPAEASTPQQGKMTGKKAGKKAPPAPPPAQLVGGPLRARMIALEKRIGLFSREDFTGPESRFRFAMMLPPNAPMSEAMASLFASDLAIQERLGRKTDVCAAFDIGPYRVTCYPFFHFDGFQAMICLERDGALIAGWKEEEVLQPESPRMVFSPNNGEEIAAMLDEALEAE